MSMMRCNDCERLVDTDDDPDSLYVVDHDDQCICEHCRDRLALKTKFDE